MAYSWFYDPVIPTNQRLAPTQATAFGMSSLASSSGSILAFDGGLQEVTLIPQTGGNGRKDNMMIISEDKSALGIATRTRASGLRFAKKDPNAMTVPNKYSLKSDYTLRR